MSTSRRVFLLQLYTASGLGVLGARAAHAQPMVAENDPVAMSLGYKADATKVDKARFPRYAAGQMCANCALYQAAAGSKAGGCALFAGRQVAAAGWCSGYARRG